MTEHETMNAILREFGTRPSLRLWRQNTGAARIGKRLIRFGVPGQADLTGILGNGKRIEIEVKSPTGRQTPEQIAFGRIIERFRGVYIVARSTDDVRRRLEDLGVEL
jgi:hypothetical protein